jgi:hypothetical protein
MPYIYFSSHCVPLIGIAMVVSLPMPILDSRRPLMEDPMTASRAAPVVAGP